MGLNLVMLGAPGAGKGTQADRFARSRGIPKISTGEILREAVHDHTEIGRLAKAVMDRGELVDDDLMVSIVRGCLERPQAATGFVLDGFPRTVKQAMALDSIIDGRSPLVVVNIEVPESELMRRLTYRLVCEDCGATAQPGADHGPGEVCRQCGGRLVQRSDDNESVVRNRLTVYHHDTEPLIKYYLGRPTFRSIDGAQAPDVVAQQLAAAVEAVLGPAGVGEGTPR